MRGWKDKKEQSLHGETFLYKYIFNARKRADSQLNVDTLNVIWSIWWVTIMYGCASHVKGAPDMYSMHGCKDSKFWRIDTEYCSEVVINIIATLPPMQSIHRYQYRT